MIQTLIALALALDALIAGRPAIAVDPTKAALYQAADDLAPIFEEMGYPYIEPVITFENLGARGRGAVYIPYWQVNHYCGHRIAIGMQYRYPNYELYGTPDILATLAHEMAHTYQGVLCERKVSTVEEDATVMGLVAMEAAGYDDALLWQLRELMILRALDEDCSDRAWMDKLSKQARDIYGDTSCLEATGRRAYTQAILTIMDDDDGIVDPPAGPEMDVSALQEMLKP